MNWTHPNLSYLPEPPLSQSAKDYRRVFQAIHSNTTQLNLQVVSPAARANQPSPPEDSCSSSHPWQCRSSPGRRATRIAYRDPENVSTILQDDHRVILIESNLVDDIISFVQVQIEKNDASGPLWSRDRFQRSWPSRTASHQQPEWCCLAQRFASTATRTVTTKQPGTTAVGNCW